jgi:CheY-like chemotaxis protein
MTRASMRKMLEKEGCRVIEAKNGEVALALMERERPSLVFLDLMMPVMDGFEFAEQMRLHPEWRTIPIVVVTAAELSGSERRRLNGYVETILHKEGNSKEGLLQQVREALDNNAVPRIFAA